MGGAPCAALAEWRSCWGVVSAATTERRSLAGLPPGSLCGRFGRIPDISEWGTPWSIYLSVNSMASACLDGAGRRLCGGA